MTSSVTISAHPVAPNNVVEVSIYSNSAPGGSQQRYVLQDGACQTFHVIDGQSLTVCEAFTTVVAAYVVQAPLVDPAQSTTG